MGPKAAIPRPATLSTLRIWGCFLLAVLLGTAGCTRGTAPASAPPAPSEEEWISLFNGRDLDGWDAKISGHAVNDNYLNTFRVDSGMLRVSYADYTNFDDKYGHLYYRTPYSYYKLRFDYRFTGDQTPGGASWNVRNSGVMLHSQSAASNEKDQNFPVSVELQMLGGLGEGERTTGNVCTPFTAVVLGDTVDYRHCISSASATYHGDRWVSAEAVVHGGEAMYFLIEGDTVLAFDHPLVWVGNGGDPAAARDWATFGVSRDKEHWVARQGDTLTGGYIALQAESHPIDFRNIELLDLCGCTDPKAKNYRSYYRADCGRPCRY